MTQNLLSVTQSFTDILYSQQERNIKSGSQDEKQTLILTSVFMYFIQKASFIFYKDSMPFLFQIF